jgi:hypothetical protein
MSGKVIVARSMSQDGFIAVPGDAQEWIFDFRPPGAALQAETAAATGAMLVGRRTDEVGSTMHADKERGAPSSDEGYPFSGPTFVLTHRPPDPPDPDVTCLTGDIGEAVATALAAAAARTCRSSAPTWPASACGGGSWPRSRCTSCRFCSATAFGSTLRVSREQTWNLSAACGREPSPSSSSAFPSGHRCSTTARPQFGSRMHGWTNARLAVLRQVMRDSRPPADLLQPRADRGRRAWLGY